MYEYLAFVWPLTEHESTLAIASACTDIGLERPHFASYPATPMPSFNTAALLRTKSAACVVGRRSAGPTYSVMALSRVSSILYGNESGVVEKRSHAEWVVQSVEVCAVIVLGFLQRCTCSSIEINCHARRAGCPMYVCVSAFCTAAALLSVFGFGQEKIGSQMIEPDSPYFLRNTSMAFPPETLYAREC